MITEAEIKSIDYNGNTCQVEIPIFKPIHSGQKVILKAIFSITPGIINSYKIGDKVFISFEDNAVDKPMVLGKVYLGSTKEQATNAGAINCNTLAITSKVNLPIEGTSFVFPNKADDSITQQITNATGYTNLLTLINKVAELSSRLEQAEEDIKALKARIGTL